MFQKGLSRDATTPAPRPSVIEGYVNVSKTSSPPSLPVSAVSTRESSLSKTELSAKLEVSTDTKTGSTGPDQFIDSLTRYLPNDASGQKCLETALGYFVASDWFPGLSADNPCKELLKSWRKPRAVGNLGQSIIGGVVGLSMLRPVAWYSDVNSLASDSLYSAGLAIPLCATSTVANPNRWNRQSNVVKFKQLDLSMMFDPQSTGVDEKIQGRTSHATNARIQCMVICDTMSFVSNPSNGMNAPFALIETVALGTDSSTYNAVFSSYIDPGTFPGAMNTMKPSCVSMGSRFHVLYHQHFELRNKAYIPIDTASTSTGTQVLQMGDRTVHHVKIPLNVVSMYTDANTNLPYINGLWLIFIQDGYTIYTPLLDYQFRLWFEDVAQNT